MTQAQLFMDDGRAFPVDQWGMPERGRFWHLIRSDGEALCGATTRQIGDLALGIPSPWVWQEKQCPACLDAYQAAHGRPWRPK